jgi:hypothetical protein
MGKGRLAEHFPRRVHHAHLMRFRAPVDSHKKQKWLFCSFHSFLLLSASTRRDASSALYWRSRAFKLLAQLPVGCASRPTSPGRSSTKGPLGAGEHMALPARRSRTLPSVHDSTLPGRSSPAGPLWGLGDSGAPGQAIETLKEYRGTQRAHPACPNLGPRFSSSLPVRVRPPGLVGGHCRDDRPPPCQT